MAERRLTSARARSGFVCSAVLAMASCALAGCSDPAGLGASDDALGTSSSAIYYKSGAIWSNATIPVCWENPSAATDTERGWVRDAVAVTWEGRSNLQFTGWGACAFGARGIRIRIADEWPRTQALGSDLDGLSGGMILNFVYTFKASDGTQPFGACISNVGGNREHCVRAIAAHEFGHAIGFAHEQNRPDTPSTCTVGAQGENGDHTIGSWDLNSIMNYCNPVWNDGGNLSATDVQAVQQLYGVTTWKAGDAWADVNGDHRADFCQITGKDNLYGSHLTCTPSVGAGFGTPFTSPVVDWGYEPGRAWTDFNGDGKADYCRAVGTTNLQSSFLECTVSAGNAFGATYTSGVVDWGYDSARAWVDFNGDGKSDYCRLVGGTNLQSSYLECTVSTGTGFGGTYTSGVVDWGYESARAWVDFNGDGKTDYCRLVGGTNLQSSYLECTVSTGTGFGGTYLSGVVDWGYDTARAWVDFNGDGKTDYCRLVGGTNLQSSYLECTVSTGAGFGGTYLSGVVDWGYASGRAWVDANGDGKADYCRVVGTTDFQSSYAECTLSTGNGFGATFLSPVIDWGYDAGRAWADVNGDGRADYTRVVGGNGTLAEEVTLSTGNGFGATFVSGTTF